MTPAAVDLAFAVRKEIEAHNRQTFTFADTHKVRIVTLDGEPWFVAAGDCSVPGLGNTTLAVRPLAPDERGLNPIKSILSPRQQGPCPPAGMSASRRAGSGAVRGRVDQRFQGWRDIGGGGKGHAGFQALGPAFTAGR